MIRYRFSDFTLSPQRRLLLRDGREVPLIPRYFDLLVLLVERRHEAVHRRDIFDRCLDGRHRLRQCAEPGRPHAPPHPRRRFARTAIHPHRRTPRLPVRLRGGHRRGGRRRTGPRQCRCRGPQAAEQPPGDAYEPLLDRLTRAGATEDDRREAAELLHALGTSNALNRLGIRPGHASARALLRDARWDAPGAGRGAGPRRLRRHLQLRASCCGFGCAARAKIAAERWAGAALGGGLAGVAAGAIGGLILAAAPGSAATVAIAPVLAAVGGVCGALGGAGVGAGLSFAEASARLQRALALISAAALGGGVVGAVVELLARWGLAALVGLDLDIGGGLEGVVIGGAAGAGYAIATRHTDGEMAAPRGRRRVRAALITGGICGLAGLALTIGDRPLVGGTIHAIAVAAHGSRATLAPLGRLIGEPDFGPVSRAILAFGEGAVFGLGLAYGLMRRPPVG